MYTYTRRCRRFIFGGNEILRFSASYPIIEASPEIGEFYASLAASCENFCEREKFPELCEPSASVGEKRLARRYNYSFSAEVEEISEKIVRIRLDVTLFRSKSEPLASFSDTQLWSHENGMMIR